jgi:dihydroorotase (multifunctional complex type)
MRNLQIQNGTVVTPNGLVEAAITVRDGKIWTIGQSPSLPEAAETLDATGLHVLPGVIDDHVHFREPGMTYKEDFGTGSLAAAAGGVTTVFDMPNTAPPLTDVKNLNEKVALVRGRSYVDFVLYAAITDSNLDQVKPLAEAGIVGFKVFMGETTGYIRCPNDGLIYEAFCRIRETGRRVGAHAENDAILQHMKSQLVAQGRKDPIAHLESRPSFAEAEAIGRAILLSVAAGNSFHVFHISTREGVEQVRQAKQKGLPVTAEVLVGHLLLDDSDYGRLGNLIRLNPPIRSQEHQKALWEGIKRGWIDNIATDHAPHSREEKTAGEVWKAACGFIGVETSLSLMLTEVNKGRLSLEEYVRLACENPARIWGIYPKKGVIQVGSDADLVLVDLKKEETIDSERLHNKSRLTPFHGRRVKGVPRYTIVRGQIVMAEGEVKGPPIGEWIKPG